MKPTRGVFWAVLAGAALVGAGCVTTKELMVEAVKLQARNELTCDDASLKTRQLGGTKTYTNGRQGKVERASWVADGCGDSGVYTVECVRGICVAVRERPPVADQKYAPRPDTP